MLAGSRTAGAGGVAHTLVVLGQVAEAQERPAEAENLYRRAADTAHDPHVKLTSLNALGSLYRKPNVLPNGLACFPR
jgi:hypothetical protein